MPETKAEEIARLLQEIGERQSRLQFLVLGDPRIGFHIGPLGSTVTGIGHQGAAPLPDTTQVIDPISGRSLGPSD